MGRRCDGELAPEVYGAKMRSPADIVREQQWNWALRRGVKLDSAGYTLDVSDNLFAPLSSAAQEEFEEADGGELGQPGERGKMQALHSSSALTCMCLPTGAPATRRRWRKPWVLLRAL